MSASASATDTLARTDLQGKSYSASQVLRTDSGFMAKVHQIAKLFADAFADPPWNRYKICPEKHYTPRGEVDQKQCLKCSKPLEICYPEDKVIEQIFRELGNEKKGRLVIFEDKADNIQAFGWGFVCSGEELSVRYHSAEMGGTLVKKIQKYMNEGAIFYISRVVVSEGARRQGIGTKIMKMLVDRASELKLNIAVRTHHESPMAQIAERIGMLPILRGGEDIENAGGVFYAKEL